MHLAAKHFGSHQKIAAVFEAAGVPTTPYLRGWQPDPG